MTKPLVIYHDSCADGFGAAFAAWLKLGDEAQYLPVSYGSDCYIEMLGYAENGIIGREVYVLDFSFPKEDMEHLFANAKRVVWLDHHKTAFEMWCDSYQGGMPCFPYQGERNFCQMYNQGNNHNGYILLDNSKSGAMLAWEYFHPDTEVPMLIRHIDDRDRWQFKLEGSKELHAALASYKPWSFEQWKEKFWSPYTGAKGYFEEQLHMLYDEGAAILRAQDVAVAQAVKHARKCRIEFNIKMVPSNDQPNNIKFFEFRNGLAVSCPLHQSEIGHELANKSGTFGLVWYLEEDGSIICSLRSNGDYDVSAIAKAFGGGGHKNAAGFSTNIGHLLEWLK